MRFPRWKGVALGISLGKYMLVRFGGATETWERD